MREVSERQQERQRQQQRQTVDDTAAGNPDSDAAAARQANEVMESFADIFQAGLRTIGHTMEHHLPEQWQNEEIRKAGRAYQSDDIRSALLSDLGSTAQDREENLRRLFQTVRAGPELPTSIEVAQDPRKHGGMVSVLEGPEGLIWEEGSQFGGDRAHGAAHEPLSSEPECGICLRGAGELLFAHDDASGTAAGSMAPGRAKYTILKRMCCNNGQCQALYCLDCLDRYCKESALQNRNPFTNHCDVRQIKCPHCRNPLADNSSLTLIDETGSSQ